MIHQLLKSLDVPFTGEVLFDHLPDIVFFIKCERGKYLAVNQTLVQRCGKKSKEEIIGSSPAELLESELGEGFSRQDEKVITSGQAIISRLELHVYPNLSEGWCLTYKVPLRNHQGRVVGLVGVSQDVRVPEREGEVYRQLSKAIHFAETNLSEPTQVTELAELAGMSHYQFDRRMKLEFGLTASQWLLKLRIDSAQNRLKETDDRIATIAMDVGYSDQSAFSRQFRNATGMTPAQYRTVHRRR